LPVFVRPKGGPRLGLGERCERACRSADARGPSEKELAGTLVVALALDECSAKIRTGPPRDDAEDLEPDVWAGNLPLVQRFGPPEPAPDLRPGPTAPGYVTGYARPGAAR
jgi:hypothetical protein